MKKLIFFMAILSIMMSCKKTSYVANFDKTPQERAADQIALVSSTLTDAPNGWVATLSTQSGGGFGFYMSFDKDQNVTMYADLNNSTSTVAGKSYYRIKQDAGTDLVFDTYNYISMLDDPNKAVYGGAEKIGYSSDVEFIYDRSTADSIVFIGKKYRQQFKMVKASAAQKASYVSGTAYKDAIDKFKTYFTDNKNPYVEITSGSTTLKIGVTPSLSTTMANGKRVDFTGVLADGKTIVSKGAKFSYNLTGIDLLNGGLTFEGISFVRFTWKDATTLAAYDAAGKEYIIKNSPVPIVPLYLLWGTKYGGMLSEYKTIYPGTSTDGAVILNYYHNGLVPPTQPYSFNYGRINFVWNTVNKRLIVNGFSSQNGGASGWTTAVGYNYTVDANGVFKFTLQSAASGGYVETPLSKLHAFLLNNSIKFEYYASGGITYSQMSSIENPATVMTFVLQ